MTGPASGSKTERLNSESGVTLSSDDTGLGSIVGNIASDLTQLVGQELELARVELKRETTKASKAAGLFAGAGAGAHIGATFLTLALVLGLSDWWDMNLAWGALIGGVLWTLTTLVLFIVARNRMQAVDPVPHQTIKTIKEGI